MLTRQQHRSNLYIRTLEQRSITQRCSQLGADQDGIHHLFIAARETAKPRRSSTPADLPCMWGVLDSASRLLALSPLLLPHLRVMRGRNRGRNLIRPHRPRAASPLGTVIGFHPLPHWPNGLDSSRDVAYQTSKNQRPAAPDVS